jgi:acyl-coenzyme A synthetase/AMP-(fatty) acid ligase
LVDHQHSGLILFSSGSTGKPKAMIHDLDNLIDSYKVKKGKKLAQSQTSVSRLTQ